MRFTVAIFILLSMGMVSAQTITGTLVGTVTDSSEAALPGVSITVIELNTNRLREATTNDSGNYSITNLTAGVYRVEFERSGLKKSIQSDVLILVGETARLNVPMEVGQITETVNVRDTPPMIQTDTSSLGAVIDQRTIQQLPSNGRQFETFVLLLPGAATAAPNSHLSSRGGFNVGGMDEHYMSFFIDGIDNVDPVIRNFSYRPSIDLIQEFKVEQSGYKAEFGRNAGAVINVTTKSGTNAWHGSAWEFFRNDNLDARNFFLPADVSKPPLIRNQFGATIGGPLSENKTFLFTAYEGLRQKTGLVRRATVPTELMRAGNLSELPPFFDPATGASVLGNVVPQDRIHPVSREVLAAYPRSNRPGTRLNRIEIANRIEDANDFSARVDHQLTTGTRVMGRYSNSVTRLVDPFRTETGGASNLSNFGQTADRFRTNVGVTLTTVKGSNFVNEFRAGFNRFRQPQIPANPGTPAQQPLMGFVKTFLSFNPGAVDPIGSGAEFKRVVNVYNYIDNVSYTYGNHQIKFGVDARRYLVNAYSVNPNIFNFNGARTGNRMADFLLGLPSSVISFDGSPGGNTRKLEFAGFVQDDWKATTKLTLNYGIRWEFFGRIAEKVNKQSFWVPECNCMQVAGVDARRGLVDNDFNNFAPRLGLAWRPFGNSTAIRASGGIFYDNDMRHNIEIVSNPPFFFTREFIYPLIPTLSLSDPFPATGSLSTLRPATFDRKFRDTYAEHWSMNIQHEIRPNLLADVAYVGNHTVKARRARNVNSFINGVPPHPGFAGITLFEQAGSSNYNALEIRIERKFSDGLGFTSSYTWGHAIDDRPGQGAGRIPNNYDLRTERADSDFDVRHRWTMSGTYNLPFGAGTRWGGWSLNGIATIQGGRPFTVNLSQEVSFTGNGADRPNLVPGIDWKPTKQDPDRWFNPNAFSIPALGTLGNAGRNTLRGPKLHNVDASIIKRTQISETTGIEIRVEVFNIFNHPNFGLPNTFADLPFFGAIPATISPERQIQFGLKVGF